MQEKNLGGRPRKKLTGIRKKPANGIYYTVPEAAKLLGVHVRTVQARCRDGTLAAKKLSGEWKIYKNSFKAKVDTNLNIEKAGKEGGK